MKKILIIDGDITILNFLKLKLSKEGFNVIISINGKEGLEKLISEKPDLLITELNLLYLNGQVIISHAKKINEKIKIIVLSAMSQETIIVESFELGVDDFISKPFSVLELIIRIKKQLQ